MKLCCDWITAQVNQIKFYKLRNVTAFKKMTEIAIETAAKTNLTVAYAKKLELLI